MSELDAAKDLTAEFCGLTESDKIKCVVCGVSDWPLGRWAVHRNTIDTPVCRGECWRRFEAGNAELFALGFWTELCPELEDEHE